MLENLVNQFYQVAQLVFQQIDQLVQFTWAKKKENFLLWVQYNFLAMNSLKKMTTKKFKKLYSDGYCMMTLTLL